MPDKKPKGTLVKKSASVKTNKRDAAGEAMKSFSKPSTVKKSDAVVRGMINKSQEKKSFANQQEKIGKAEIKNKVTQGKVLDLKGTTTPVGKKRIEIANKLKQEAKRDSLAAVSMSKKSAPVKKKK
jgi:hypothetical protein